MIEPIRVVRAPVGDGGTRAGPYRYAPKDQGDGGDKGDQEDGGGECAQHGSHGFRLPQAGGGVKVDSIPILC